MRVAFKLLTTKQGSYLNRN